MFLICLNYLELRKMSYPGDGKAPYPGPEQGGYPPTYPGNYPQPQNVAYTPQQGGYPAGQYVPQPTSKWKILSIKTTMGIADPL